MPTHTKICSVEFNNGKNSLCLDKVIMDDKQKSIQFSFVSRGGKKSPDQFIPRQAYFTWDMLGELLRNAMQTKGLTKKEKNEFLDSLMGIK